MTLETGYPRPDKEEPYPHKTIPERAVLTLLKQAIDDERHIKDMEREFEQLERQVQNKQADIHSAKRQSAELFRAAIEFDPRLKNPDGGINLARCYELYPLHEFGLQPLQHISV